MVLRLYGHSHMTCTRRVGTILREKNIPFELIEIDIMKGEHKLPQHLQKQPFGQTPYIVRSLLLSIHENIAVNNLILTQDDDGFVLYESRAICRYLATKYADRGAPLIPTGLKDNALFEQAASIEQNNFDPYASKAVAEIIIKPYVLRSLTLPTTLY